MPLGALAPAAVAAFAGGLALLAWLDWPPAAAEHLVLAVGILPLILTAMGYFTPVLTRGAAPGRALTWIPLLALAGGAWVFLALLLAPPAFHPAALPALVAAAALAGWMRRRARAGLGAPHPCLSWYLAALACLGLALLAILATALFPDQWLALKRLHLHLNLLGFVGLTAVGTQRVLLPTAGGYADPSAAVALRRDLPLTLGGTLLAGFGAGWFPPLAVLGGALWSVPLGRFLWGLLGPGRPPWFRAAPARLLAAALLGFTAALAAGLLHGIGGWGTDRAVGLFLLWFLFPLVLGASTQLLPVWWGGAAVARQAVLRERLARGALPRLGLLLAAGALWAAGSGLGWRLGLIALLWHLGRVLHTRLFLWRLDRAGPRL
jgi:hypothetical protein